VPKDKLDTYGTDTARTRSYKEIANMFRAEGVENIFVKALASNDNSKNQIYLGGNFSSLNLIPVENWNFTEPSSKKSSLKPGRRLIHGGLHFSWITPSGEKCPAPGAKLILYPQYPEVRLSGFLLGSNVNISEWFNEKKSGRSLGRYLVIGVHPLGRSYAYLAVPDSRAAKELEAAGYTVEDEGVLEEVGFSLSKRSKSSRDRLIEELARIHQDSPVQGKKLSKGKLKTYNASNGGGYTLEAELGIEANGYAGPDFLGWEIKGHSGPVVTLMTPEPTGGHYKDKGIDWFIRTYGYPDKKGRPDRLNFGGIHKANVSHKTTGLTFTATGFDEHSKDLDLDGAIQLLTQHGDVASEWSFAKLLEHWNKKHAQAAYVPYSMEMKADRFYHYDRIVDLGIGTDFLKFLEAVSSAGIYLDPGIKMEHASTLKPKIKKRNQFRINYRNLPKLYDAWETIDVLT
jgi:hypothetical protein